MIQDSKKMEDFVLFRGFNYDFHIIKEDCREREIGLILFDVSGKHFFKILNASYFKSDIFRKQDYLINLRESKRQDFVACKQKEIF